MKKLTIFDFLDKKEHIPEILVEGSERQSHGFNYENKIMKKYNIRKSEKYTSKWDGFLGKIPVSVKTSKFGTDVELGDIFRQLEIKENFYLFVGFWEKNKNNIVKEYILYIDVSKWTTLFNTSMNNDFFNLLKSVSNDKADDYIWTKKTKTIKEKWEATTPNLIRVRFKRDHKKQKRIQCAINYMDFLSYFTKEFQVSKPKGTTKSQGKKHKFDKFYTKTSIAENCIKSIDLTVFKTIIEPSAGAGAFSNQIEGCLAYDIEPENETIQKKDWFTFVPDKNIGKTLVIGNPPFGEQNNLAVNFFNHAATFADTIAFILPKSFKKESVKNRLNKNFHLKDEIILPVNSFELNGEDFSVPTIFQVWEKKKTSRKTTEKKLKSTYFDFVQQENADIRIPRVGGNAGKATLKLTAAKTSNYFIKNNTKISNEAFVELINQQKFPSIDFTTGPRSLPKTELITTIEKAFEKKYFL